MNDRVVFSMEVLSLGSGGPLVELLQSVLRRRGFFGQDIDGIFGPVTRQAVMEFQRQAGITVDGIAGWETWSNLHPYINGYVLYSIRPGDTLSSIAAGHDTSLESVLAANPSIEPEALLPGQRIVVPSGQVVPTDISYSYDILMMNMFALNTVYPFLEISYIGFSEMGKSLPCIRLGRGPTEVFYNASFHANEWITSVVMMAFIENYSYAYVHNSTLFGYKVCDMFKEVSIYIAPIINPDGVDLVTGAIRPGSEVYRSAERIAAAFPDIPFPEGWKANIRGIDLNLQFPANWDMASEIKGAQGFTQPAPRDYPGAAPLSASESIAAYHFTRQHDFRLILAYHTQGQVIYWKYLDYTPEGALYIGMRMSEASGYALEQTPYASGFAGYKDWFIQEYNRPGYTIEAGIGVSPLPISQFGDIYRDNEGILVLGAVLAEKSGI